MNLSEKIREGQKFLNDITIRCWEDENFKNQLLNKPVATIEKFTGKSLNLPENKVLKIEDQTDEQYIYINIPRKPDVDNLELTDEELENVVGGDFWLGVGASVAAWVIVEYAGGVYDGLKHALK